MVDNPSKYIYMLDGKKVDIQDRKTFKAAVLLVDKLLKHGVSLSDAVKNITSFGHPHIVVNFTKFMKNKNDTVLFENLNDELVSLEMKKEKKQKKLQQIQSEIAKEKNKVVTEKVGSVMQDAIDRKNGFYTAAERKLVVKFNRDPNKKISDQNYQNLRLDKATAKLRNLMQYQDETLDVTRKIVKEDKDY